MSVPEQAQASMQRGTKARGSPPRGWVRSHPVLALFALTCAVSWLTWIPWAFGYQRGVGAVFFIVGGFGPAVSAAIITRYTGGSVAALARPSSMARSDALLPVRARSSCGAAHGGQSRARPTRRGRRPLAFAWASPLIPHVVRLHSYPRRGAGGGGMAWVRAAAARGSILAASGDTSARVRGVWHIPAYGTPLAIVFPLVLAFFYTWLYNRSGSILICILLHESFTPTLGAVRPHSGLHDRRRGDLHNQPRCGPCPDPDHARASGLSAWDLAGGRPSRSPSPRRTTATTEWYTTARR